MDLGGRDVLRGSVDADDVRAQTRQRLAEQARAASHIQRALAGQRPHRPVVSVPISINRLTKITKPDRVQPVKHRSEDHTTEPQSLMLISYDVFCLKKKNSKTTRLLTYVHT